MNEKPVPTEPTLIDCEICLKEIPDSVATTEEGEETETFVSRDFIDFKICLEVGIIILF